MQKRETKTGWNDNLCKDRVSWICSRKTCGSSTPTAKTTTTTSIQTTTTTMKTRDTPGDSTTPALVAGSVSAGVVLVLGAVLAIVCACRRRRMNSESETAEDDVNPVYATYEIHDDPVAEVYDRNMDYDLNIYE